MAPYNLSDLAVKEIKLPKGSLAPAVSKNHNGRFLMALFLDFWAIFTLNFFVATFFQNAVKLLLTTSSLRKVWSITDLTALNTLSWFSIATVYFFTCFYLNHGQTYGMYKTKCRITMNEHDLKSSFQWAMMSLSLYFSLGLSFFFVKKMEGKIAAHDHLWHELVAQKEMAAPDVRTLIVRDATLSRAA